MSLLSYYINLYRKKGGYYGKEKAHIRHKGKDSEANIGALIGSHGDLYLSSRFSRGRDDIKKELFSAYKSY